MFLQIVRPKKEEKKPHRMTCFSYLGVDPSLLEIWDQTSPLYPPNPVPPNLLAVEGSWESRGRKWVSQSQRSFPVQPLHLLLTAWVKGWNSLAKAVSLIPQPVSSPDREKWRKKSLVSKERIFAKPNERCQRRWIRRMYSSSRLKKLTYKPHDHSFIIFESFFTG